MGVYNGSFYSKSMNMDTSIGIILPHDSRKHLGVEPLHPGITPSDKPRTLILLHGLSDNWAAWMHRTSILRYAELYDIAVLAPEVHLCAAPEAEGILLQLIAACGDSYEKNLADFIRAQDGVVSLDTLRTRKFGSKVYIDAEISVDGSMTLSDAHSIAERVHNAVEHKYPDIKHIMIHENPASASAE